MRMRTLVAVSILTMTIAILVTLTVTVYNFFSPNARSFLAGNIRLLGSLDKHAARYRVIQIGTPSDPYDGSLELSFRCGSTEFDIDVMSTEELEDIAVRIAAPDAVWPQHARQIVLYDHSKVIVWIVVLDEQIVQLEARSDDSGDFCEAQFRTSRSNSWIAFPITDAGATNLFGTPDRTNDFFMH